MRWNDTERTLTIDGPDGAYPGMPERRRLRARRIAPGAGWRQNGTDAPVTGEYRGQALSLDL